MIIGILIDGKLEVYNQIKSILLPEDFKKEENKKIMQKLYEEFEKGNINTSNIVEIFGDDQEVVSILTGIMAVDYEIKDDKKAIEDLINNYKKEKLTNRKKEIIDSLNDESIDKQEIADLEKELHEIILNLAKMK